MTEAEVNEVLRRRCGKYRRVFLIIYLVVTAAGAAAMVAGDPGVVAFGAIGASLGALLAWRATRLSVAIQDGRMVVRSWASTSTIDLRRIERFDVGSDAYLRGSPSGLFSTLFYLRDDGRAPTVPAIVCLRLGLLGSEGMYPLAFELNHLLAANQPHRPV